MVNTRASLSAKQKAVSAVKKRQKRAKVNRPSGSVASSTRSQVISNRRKEKPPAQYRSGSLVDAKRSCKRLRPSTDEIASGRPMPPNRQKKFKRDVPQEQDEHSPQANQSLPSTAVSSELSGEMDPIARLIEAGKLFPALVTESETITNISKPSAFVNAPVKIALSDVVDRLEKTSVIVDSFIALMTRSCDEQPHAPPSSPTRNSEPANSFDTKKVGYLKELLFPQMGARSAGAVPAEISSTGAIVSIIQATLRIDVHSKDITQLINQALGDLDNPPRAYLLLAEGKLRALRAHKLPVQSRGGLRFQVLGLGDWEHLNERLHILFQLLTGPFYGRIQLRARAARARLYYADAGSDSDAGPPPPTEEETRATVKNAKKALMFGVRILGVCCEYIRFVRTNILAPAALPPAESMEAIGEMLQGVESLEEHMRRAGMKGAALKNVAELRAELSALIHGHYAVGAVEEITSGEVMEKLPTFASFGSASVDRYVGSSLRSVVTLVSDAIKPWEGNLQPDAVVLYACRQIKGAVDRFVSNVTDTSGGVDMSGTEVAKQVGGDLDRATTALLHKMKLKLLGLQPASPCRSNTSAAAEQATTEPQQSLAARVDAMLADLPKTTKTDDDKELLQLVGRLGLDE